MKLDRRTFLMALGVASAAAATPRRIRATRTRPPRPGGRCFLAAACPPPPPARPRSAAITYLSP